MVAPEDRWWDHLWVPGLSDKALDDDLARVRREYVAGAISIHEFEELTGKLLVGERPVASFLSPFDLPAGEDAL